MEFDAQEFLMQLSDSEQSRSSVKKLRKDALLKICKELELKVTSKAKKAEILKAIENQFVTRGLWTQTASQSDTDEEEMSGLRALCNAASRQKARSHTRSPVEKSAEYEIRKMELEFELKLHREKWEREYESEARKLESDRLLQLEMLDKRLRAEREIEFERLRNTSAQSESAADSAFLKSKSFVPKFCEKDPEQFFACFERTAKMFNWPEDKWPLLIQSVLVGKAQRAYAALSDSDAQNYSEIKSAILSAYELCNEAYRQRFRSWKKSSSQTHLEFAKDKARFFERWVNSAKVKTVEDLSQLILIEEFKSCVTPAIKVHLEDKDPKTLDEAAKLADSFDLVHKPKSTYMLPKKPTVPEVSKDQSNPPTSDGAKSESEPKPIRKKPPECDFCHKKGHLRASCWKLYGKSASNADSKTKPVTTAWTNSEPMEPKSQKAEFTEPLTDPQISLSETLRKAGASAFQAEGRVATSEKNPQGRPINVFRDTGAFQSLIRADALPLDANTATGQEIQIADMCGTLRVPLHKIFLDSKVWSGEILVGKVQKLPIEGIHLIIGNEIAGDSIWSSRAGQISTESINKATREPEENSRVAEARTQELRPGIEYESTLPSHKGVPRVESRDVTEAAETRIPKIGHCIENEVTENLFPMKTESSSSTLVCQKEPTCEIIRAQASKTCEAEDTAEIPDKKGDLPDLEINSVQLRQAELNCAIMRAQAARKTCEAENTGGKPGLPATLTDLEMNSILLRQAEPNCAVTRAQAARKTCEADNTGGETDHPATLQDLEITSLPLRQAELNCAITRAQAARKTCEAENTGGETDLPDLEMTQADLIKAQQNDAQLKKLFSFVDKKNKHKENVYLYKKDRVLMRHFQSPKAKANEPYRHFEQIVLPDVYRQHVLQLTHDNALSRHLSVRKTLYNIRQHYFWPNMSRDVTRYRKTCHTCQLARTQRNSPKDLLRPIPGISERLENEN